MQCTLSTRPYAEAFYNCLENDETRKEVFPQFEFILNKSEEDHLFGSFLDTQRISRAKKAEFLEKTFRGKLHDTLLNFMLILAKRGCLGNLKEIHQNIQLITELADNRKRVSVTTAVALDEDTRSQMVKFLGEKLQSTVILEEKVDAEIIGGFIIRIEDTLINGSLKHHLEKIKKRILDSKTNKDLKL